MLLNLCHLCTVLLSVVLVAWCDDVFSTKYHQDSNRLIKRLHASAHAKLFLHGCEAEPYIELTTNTTNAKNESNFFELQKSEEYLFAIFTLDEVKLILSNTNEKKDNEKNVKNYDYYAEDVAEESVAEEDYVSFNITLGINKNSMARLEVFANRTLIGNISEQLIPILPTIPYYVNVSITEDNISVYEARTGASEPFLSYNFNSSSNMNLTNYKYFVKFRHSSPIYAHYDCCEACTPWIYTRISGCSKYSARASVETTHLIKLNNSPNQTDNVLFNQNILVHHDGRPTFRAKIIFSEIDIPKGNRYEIGLSDSPTILHYFNKSAQFLKSLDPGVTLKRKYTSPFIVNITITSDGIVSLRQPYEQYPFLAYGTRFQQPNLEPVNVKYMTMAKVHEDFVRYDFFHNCTDLLCFNRKHELPIHQIYDVRDVADETDDYDNDTDKYPMIWEYASKRFNTTKYDVLHVFQDSYQIYEKSSQIPIEVGSDYEDKASANLTKSGPGSEKTGTNPSAKGKGGSFSEIMKKTVVGVGSFLFVGILKLICQMEFVKNLMKEADVDDDKAKDLRKSVSNVVNKNIANTLGFHDEE